MSQSENKQLFEQISKANHDNFLSLIHKITSPFWTALLIFLGKVVFLVFELPFSRAQETEADEVCPSKKSSLKAS